ncbi:MULTISPECIES: OB-fold nucleic acid binding domain-containing protein [Saccharopolyspora]|uniref:OB-fold nucleic acid binding domain-containing protein n=1 Tax=Saccharopolyspora cebuensis TaxID=418759 RepID=A0ABV4CFF7_9PSEU
MSNTGGYWRRLVRRLTSDVAELDADDLSERSEAGGARHACDCRGGEEAVVLGRLRSVGRSPKASAPTLEAELYDGTDEVVLVWLGRRQITGIEPGRVIKARGRIAVRDGRKVLYNPYYELQNTA